MNNPYNFQGPFNFRLLSSFHNFCLILSKVVKLHVLESTLKFLKAGQKLISLQTHSKKKQPFEILKIFTFSRTVLSQKKKIQILILTLLQDIGKSSLLPKNSGKTGNLLRNYGSPNLLLRFSKILSRSVLLNVV